MTLTVCEGHIEWTRISV